MKSTFRILFYAKWEAKMDKLSAALSGTSFSLNSGKGDAGDAVASTEETSN